MVSKSPIMFYWPLLCHVKPKHRITFIVCFEELSKVSSFFWIRMEKWKISVQNKRSSKLTEAPYKKSHEYDKVFGWNRVVFMKTSCIDRVIQYLIQQRNQECGYLNFLTKWYIKRCIVCHFYHRTWYQCQLRPRSINRASWITIVKLVPAPISNILLAIALSKSK